MAEKKSLSDRMKPAKSIQSAAGDSSVAASFKKPAEEYPKRLTLDLTVTQHRKLKIRAMNEGVSMNQLLRDYIDTLPE
jgi:predicted HicB family RNase H-like nuclease